MRTSGTTLWCTLILCAARGEAGSRAIQSDNANHCVEEFAAEIAIGLPKEILGIRVESVATRIGRMATDSHMVADDLLDPRLTPKNRDWGPNQEGCVHPSELRTVRSSSERLSKRSECIEGQKVHEYKGTSFYQNEFAIEDATMTLPYGGKGGKGMDDNPGTFGVMPT